VQMLSSANLSALDSEGVDVLDAHDTDSPPSLSVHARPASVADSLDSLADVDETHPSRHASAGLTDKMARLNSSGASPSPCKSRAIPIRAHMPRQRSCNGMTPGSVSSSVGTSLLDSAPRDFTMNGKVLPEPADSKVLHVTSPGMYMHNLKASGLELIDFRDLSEHLSFFYEGMVDEARVFGSPDVVLVRLDSLLQHALVGS
jgi:hypothetical protein